MLVNWLDFLFMLEYKISNNIFTLEMAKLVKKNKHTYV